MANKTTNQAGPPTSTGTAEDRSESPQGVGTPGGAKGGAWGKADSHHITGSAVTAPQRGRKPWMGSDQTDNRGSKSVESGS